jgi:hypothetical protein
MKTYDNKIKSVLSAVISGSNNVPKLARANQKKTPRREHATSTPSAAGRDSAAEPRRRGTLPPLAPSLTAGPRPAGLPLPAAAGGPHGIGAAGYRFTAASGEHRLDEELGRLELGARVGLVVTGVSLGHDRSPSRFERFDAARDRWFARPLIERPGALACILSPLPSRSSANVKSCGPKRHPTAVFFKDSNGFPSQFLLTGGV